MKVFFSHAGRDKPLLREIQANLPRHIRVWLDEREIRAGQYVEGALWTAIRREVDALVVFIGPEAVQSEWVRKELEWGRRREAELRKLFVLPVVLNEPSWTKLPDEFQNRRYLTCEDFTEYGVRAFAARLSDELFAYAASENLEPLGVEWALESREDQHRREHARSQARKLVAGQTAPQRKSRVLKEIITLLRPFDRLRLLCHYELVKGTFAGSRPPDLEITVLVSIPGFERLEQRLDWSDEAHSALRYELSLGDEKYLVHPRILDALDDIGEKARADLFFGVRILELRTNRKTVGV